MKTEDQIAGLKAAGYTVTIQHWRSHHRQVEEARRARARGITRAQPAVAPHHLYNKGDVSPHGGKTICILSLDDQEIVRGVAVCSPEDVYRKSYGRDKAVGRAVKALRSLSADSPEAL